MKTQNYPGFLGGRRRSVGALLSQRPAPQADRGAGTTGFRAPIQENELKTALLGLLKDRTQLQAGHFQVIGLDDIKARYGVQWDAVAERAHDITCRAIERRMSASDFYVKASDLQYLIVLSELDTTAAQIKCGLISDEIERLLVGDNRGLEGIAVQCAVGDVRAGLKLEALPSLDALVAKTKAAGVPENALAARNVEVANPDDPNHILQDVRLIYRPTWHVSKNALSVFHGVPALAYPGGSVLVGEAAIPRMDEPAVAFALDMRWLRSIIDTQRRLTGEGRRVLLSVPVHFETLASGARRAQYVELCKQMPPLAHRLTVFELVDAPSGIPQVRLLEFASALRAYARVVVMRVSIDTTMFYPFSQTGVFGVSAVIDQAMTSERQIIRAINRLAVETSKLGLISIVHGLRSLSLTAAAIGAGIHYIGGDAITSIVDFPRDIRAFNPKHLYARFLPERSPIDRRRPV